MAPVNSELPKRPAFSPPTMKLPGGVAVALPGLQEEQLRSLRSQALSVADRKHGGGRSGKDLRPG